MSDLADQIRNYPDDARVIVTWRRDGSWSEDAFPVSALKAILPSDDDVLLLPDGKPMPRRRPDGPGIRGEFLPADNILVREQ